MLREKAVLTSVSVQTRMGKDERPTLLNVTHAMDNSTRPIEYNHVKQKIQELPQWVQSYMQWHASQRLHPSKKTKFAVIVCLKDARCGGLSDRLKSIPYWLQVANQTGRVLLIHWTKGHALEEFWVPPLDGLNWSIPDAWNSNKTMMPICLDKEQVIRYWYADEDEEITGPKGVVCVQSQSDLYPEVQSDFTTEAHPQGTYSQLYNTMFEPSVPLQEFIDNKLHDLGLQPGEPFLSVQIRSAYPIKSKEGLVRPNLQNYPNMVKYWAERAVQRVVQAYQEHYGNQTNHSLPPVYVTADNENLVQYLKVNSSASKTVRILGLESMPRANIEFSKAPDASAWFPTFLDLWLLSNSQCVAYGVGGYGRFGARLAGDDCAIQHRKSQHWEQYLREVPTTN